MLRQPRRIEPRKGSSVLGSHARVQSVLSRASDAVIPYGVRCRMTGQHGPALFGRNTKVLSLVPSRIFTMAWKARAPPRSASSIAILRKKRAGDHTGSLNVWLVIA